MNIWTIQEIAKKLPAISASQLTDLAEKGISITCRETRHGLARHYDNIGVFKILIAMQCRGMIPPEKIKIVLGDIYNVSVNYDYYVIKKTGYGTWYYYPVKKNEDIKKYLSWNYKHAKKQDQMDSGNFVLNLKATRDFVDEFFGD